MTDDDDDETRDGGTWNAHGEQLFAYANKLSGEHREGVIGRLMLTTCHEDVAIVLSVRRSITNLTTLGLSPEPSVFSRAKSIMRATIDDGVHIVGDEP